MAKKNNKRKIAHIIQYSIIAGISLGLGCIVGGIQYFELTYANKIYPSVFLNRISFKGKTPEDTELYWNRESIIFQPAQFTFVFDDKTATISARELGVQYDAALAATQAFLVGRSKQKLSNITQRYFQKEIDMTVPVKWNTDVYASFSAHLADQINIPVEDALFQFKNGKVTAFKPSKKGRFVDEEALQKRFIEAISRIEETHQQYILIPIPVDIVEPIVATDKANSFGIKELIGRGYSEFSGSIPGRIHNVALAASKLHGILIKPGEEFSFNKTVGDISAATGYQSAYIIKDGRTVLGDGGGVCQVSTTLFRAALNTGLPITERHEHSYRVHYYEEGGYKAGLDATVFDPTNDLKFINDTPGYILVQAKTDTANLTLAFELYGTSDGRKSEILNHSVWGIIPPPAPLYQDDPTLPKGVVKQVDFSAWGAKASFLYRVTRGGTLLFEKTFNSNFRPWQAVFLRGTQ